MIYWFTGQPGHGKTALAKALKEHIDKLNWSYSLTQNPVFHIDGDDLRKILVNKDYSQQGREANIRTAQSIARYLHNQGHEVVVSLVSPYRDLREEFKKLGSVCEIYVHTADIRGRESYHVKEYEAPVENFIEIDTTGKTIEQSLEELLIKLEGS
jgi:adenylylsulfate kinase